MSVQSAQSALVGNRTIDLNDVRSLDSNGFPAYPKIEAMPPLPAHEDRLKFAFELVNKHGEYVADYVYAQFRHASSPEEMVRWDMLSLLIEEILGRPLAVSYDVKARLAIEGIDVELKDDDFPGVKPHKRLPGS